MDPKGSHISPPASAPAWPSSAAARASAAWPPPRWTASPASPTRPADIRGAMIVAAGLIEGATFFALIVTILLAIK